MEWLPQLILIAVFAAVGWYLFRPPAVFVVHIRAGQTTAASGVVTPAFLAFVREICEEFHIQSGEVRGVRRGRRIALHFSRNLPPPFCQRLRNWWAQSGWTARPRHR